MGVCEICGKESPLISSFLGVCGECVLKKESFRFVREAHRRARERFGLPPEVPKGRGSKCFGCGNECVIPENGKGYCGLVENRNSKLIRLAGTPEKGLVSFYFDPLPTNCVATPFCEGAKERGYNLAVFYGACNFDCLFCQNWEFKGMTREVKPLMSAEELAEKANEETKCVCYFGGDPNPQLSHAIETSKILAKRGVRVCMETNGNANWRLLEKFAGIAFETGGCVKFDLKAWNERLNIALCGISNRVTLRNFEKLAGLRWDSPFLVASTLLVPGYVTPDEVEKISKFIASLNPSIPYVLLAFYPTFLMDDLPTTSKELAEECLRRAKENGLERVKIGNVHLLR